ncbi:uncharacterized protein TRIADDRAFT_56512 [Trichoplax adhaerens]|uniref:Uncharacterized protein n=1 Tax=Trichoplax adhaerens TaxID=10228 RepID=B3RYC7_TRIAD|nr:predicted protein [Trichoplax adhaerens]EDV25015.1 predicted protein [Trichoplax adhaerens]|eukprot:XP_002112905.1 predicted protein [Trichoplax adhaerens]
MPSTETVYNSLRNPMDVMPCHPNSLPLNKTTPPGSKISLLPPHYRESNPTTVSNYLNGCHLRSPMNNPSLIRLNSTFIPPHQQSGQYQADLIRTPPRHEYSPGHIPLVAAGLRVTNPNMTMPPWLAHIKANGANMAAVANANNPHQLNQNQTSNNDNVSVRKIDREKISKPSTTPTPHDTEDGSQQENKIESVSNTDSDNSRPSSSSSNQGEIKNRKRKAESPVAKSVWRPY